MRKLSIAIILITLSTFKFSDTCAQNRFPLQPFANPQILNPAFTGFFQNPRIGLNYLNFSKGNSISTNFIYDQSINFLSGGIGLSSIYNSSLDGAASHFSVSGLYAFEKLIDENSGIRVGINAGFNQSTIDMPISTSGKISKNYFNIGAGVLGYHKNFYAGFSVLNITEPKVKFNENASGYIPRTFNMHTGGFIHLSDNLTKGWMLNPYATIQSLSPYSDSKMEWRNTYGLGLNVSKSIFTAGMQYSMQNQPSGIIGSAGINAGNFKIGYATPLWNFKNLVLSTHEVSLIYQFNKPKDISKNKMANNFKRIF